MSENRRIVVAAAVGVLMVSGCAGVPTSGAVHLGNTLPSVTGVDDRAIHAYPQGPVAGQSPVEVVTQYLDAMVDNDSKYGIARRFLAAGTSWNSASRIRVYRQSSLTVTAIRPRLVRASFDQVGVIDARGSYRVAPHHRTARFRLARGAGQWRISGLAPGVLLSTSDALRSLEPVNLYFLAQAQDRVVPDPILVPPDQPGLATILVRALIDGPAPRLAAAVETAVPDGLVLVGNVPIDHDGNAEVNLSGGIQQLSSIELQRLSAQLVWTLRQVPTVTGVRLLDNGTPLTDDGVPRVQPVDLWRQYGPNAAALAGGALLMRRGVVIGERHTVPKSLMRPGLSAPVFSAGGARVAAIGSGGRGMTLLIGSAAGTLRPVLSAPVLSSPSFDPSGDVYVVNGIGRGATVAKLPPSGAPREVMIPHSVLARGVSSLSISRDAARIAMVVGPPGRAALLIGGLASVHGASRVTGLATVVSGDHDAAGVAWATTDQVVTTVARGAGRTVLRISVDGYRSRAVTSVGLPRQPTQVAAAPGEPLLATAAGAVWARSGVGWTRLSTGTDPAYAG